MNLTAPVSSAKEKAKSVEKIFRTVNEEIIRQRHIPISTYRLQFNRFFTFKDASKQIEYFKALGISDLYASPYFKARPESMHGYDITDHNSLNPSIGTEKDYNEMVEQLHRQGMYQLLDIVPNHMGIGEINNHWWMDVLENGPSSVYSSYFDIEWHPLKQELNNKVLLPILGELYGRVLEDKELQLSFNPEMGLFQLNYYEKIFPLNPRSYIFILELRHEELIQTLGPENEALIEYESILTALNHLPKLSKTEREKVLERNREKEVVKRRIATLCSQEPQIKPFIQENINIINGKKGAPHSFDRLDLMLKNQAYRLSYWRVAAEEINYRRFFDINELAAIRVELPVVFEDTHRMIFQLIREGKLNGLRVDHIDGLRDPAGYLQNLQRAHFLTLCRRHLEKIPLPPEGRLDLEEDLLAHYDQEIAHNPQGFLGRSLYVVVEKILGRGESLPAAWPVSGTTGYEFTNLVNALFVNSAHQKAFDQIYQTFIGEKIRFTDLNYEKKKQIMALSLASEVNVLTNLL